MAAHQAPPSLGFSRQEHWSGLPFPSPMHESENESEVAQSCRTLSDPMDWSLPGSSIHGIFQARVLEWGAIAFSWWLFHNKRYEIWKQKHTKNNHKSLKLKSRFCSILYTFTLETQDFIYQSVIWSLPGGTSRKEPTCQDSRCEFVTWVGKIPWRMMWQPTQVFLLGESHGQRSLATVHGLAELNRLSDWAHICL